MDQQALEYLVSDEQIEELINGFNDSREIDDVELVDIVPVKLSLFDDSEYGEILCWLVLTDGLQDYKVEESFLVDTVTGEILFYEPCLSCHHYC